MCGVRHDVDADLRVELVEVDRRRHSPLLEGEDRDQGAQCTRGSQQVAGHRLRGRDLRVRPDRAEDRATLVKVAEWSGRRVGVHQPDVRGGQPRRPERQFDRSLLVLRIRGDDVVGVRGERCALEERVDGGTSRPRMVLPLQHQQGRALAEYETVACAVERPGCRGRVAFPAGQRPGLRQRAQGEPGDAGIRSAREHDVGTAREDHLPRHQQGLGPRGAGAHRCSRPAARVDVDGQPGGRAVRHHHGHGVRGHAP